MMCPRASRTTPYKYESFRYVSFRIEVKAIASSSLAFFCILLAPSIPSLNSFCFRFFPSFLVCVAEHITRTLYSIANVTFIGALK